MPKIGDVFGGSSGKPEVEAARQLKEGNYLTAGKLLEEAGQLSRAVEVYLKGNEFAAAAEVCLRQGRNETAAELFLKDGGGFALPARGGCRGGAALMRAATVWGQGWKIAVFAGLVALSGVARAHAVLDWLNRAAVAAKQQNYSGVYVYHQGEHVEVLRVQHRIDAAGEQERVEVLDGAPRQFLRINNDVYCHLQDGKSVRMERNTARRFFPAAAVARPACLRITMQN